MRDAVRIILLGLATLVAGLTLLGLGDRLGLRGAPGWALDLLSHWPKHLFLASLVIACLAGWRRLHAPAALAAATAAMNLTLVIGTGGFALPEPAPAQAQLVRVVSANVHGSHDSLEKLAELAKDYGADIVSAYEVPDDLTLADVARLFPDLPVREIPSVGVQDLKLVRRSMLAAREADGVNVSAYPSSHGVIIRANAAGVQLVTTHPPSPADPGLKYGRDTQLGDTANRLDQTQPFLIVGDFNSTPWGRAYSAVPGTRAGDPRFDGTFPSLAGWFGLPIDHIKFGGGLTLTDYRLGNTIGSDHLPLFATFALPDSDRGASP